MRRALSGLLAAALSGMALCQNIRVDAQASPQELLAAREIQRYLYLRTGRLLPVDSAARSHGLIVARKDRRLPRMGWMDEKTKRDVGSLGPQDYLLASLGRGRFLVAGGSDVGVLYGAYRFAEKLGVRFYLHGDVVPDRRIPCRFPRVRELGRPLFALRGINPFHDFPEGPDWWNRDDYLQVIGQLPKLRMNFFGLHTYPEGGVGPEPAVWIGRRQDLLADGSVSASYPSSWANTVRPGSWGYVGSGTTPFSCGADQLFPGDHYGPSVMAGMMPMPATPAQSNRLFEDVGRMLGDAFAEARSLGVKTCVGTETPLTIPALVRERLRAEGKDPARPEVVQEVYAAMFTRIARLYPVDYYWLWTPEDWTWGGNTAEQLRRTTGDIHAALAALDSIGNPFRLATCGWVLGPQNDRAALDRLLPKTVPVSAINQRVGNAPIEPGFGKIQERSKWAIPWMENDPALTAPQLWAGRMRYDAADARRLGCDGLLGIHWRTKILAPNVSALAQAAWDQSWKPAEFERSAAEMGATRPGPRGAIGGETSQFTAHVAGTDEQPIYQTVRYDMDGYELELPNGAYSVTLKFNEPFYSQPGKRVFAVELQGRRVIDRLDIFARVGQNRALDFTFNPVTVRDGRLRIHFVKQVEFPSVAGILVTRPGFERKINCGGTRFDGYEGELDAPAVLSPDDRTIDPRPFYEDFARANFGESVAREAGSLLGRIDGMRLPRPATWLTGPGDIAPNRSPWAEVAPSYAFVDRFAALRPRVGGAGNLERFDYWLNSWRYMRAMAFLGCQRGRLDLLADQMKSQTAPLAKRATAERTLKLRLEMARLWERMMGFLEATVSTPGELGTISNLEQHVRMVARFLDRRDAEIEKALGRALPPESQPGRAYRGPARIIVPTVRTSVAPGERLALDVILASPGGEPRGTLYWRRVGSAGFARIPLSRVGRRVYRAVLPPAVPDSAGLEYFIRAQFDTRTVLTFPASAPAVGQTLVVTSLVPRGR